MSEAAVAPEGRRKFHMPAALKRIRIPGPLKWIGAILLALIVAVLLFLAFADWNMLRGPIGRFASARLDRTVELRGNLDVHPFHWSPRAEIDDLYIADTDWSGKPHMARIQRLEVAVRLLPLLRGEVILPKLIVIRPDLNLLRQANGRNNWTLGKPDKKKEPGKFPAIQRLVIDTGRMRYDDREREIALNVTMSTREEQGRDARFRMRGDGSINSEPFTLAVTGGPLLNVDPDKPYPFDADIKAGGTTLTARGSVTKPFDIGRFETKFTLAGPDLNRLYGLTGLALPNTPPYKLNGTMVRDGTKFDVPRFSGEVGDSDLSGRMTLQTRGERPKIDAALTSRRLDFDDLAVIFGGAPDPTETANAEQKATAARLKLRGRLLPDATLQVDRVRAMDADVTYRAAAINAPGLPLKDVSLAVDLNDGLLKINDIDLGFPQGQLTGTAQLDARQKTPLVDLDVRVRGLALQQFLTKTGAAPITGNLVARAKLSGSGNSVRRAAASADGSVTLVIPRGEVREAFAELIGINVIKGLGLLFSKDTGRVQLACAVADFRVADGIMSGRTLLADTEPTLVTGAGTVSLRDETMNLELKGNPKKFRLVSLNAPVTVTGSLQSPKIGVRPGGAIAQAGIGAALLAFVSPLVAILPFVDPGLADDANCSALLSGARGKGAPVTKAQAAGASRGG